MHACVCVCMHAEPEARGPGSDLVRCLGGLGQRPGRWRALRMTAADEALAWWLPTPGEGTSPMGRPPCPMLSAALHMTRPLAC